MILVRSPLRITLGGGGTDLPAYYREHGGMFLTAAIDKYVYAAVLKPFVPGIILKYGHGGTEQCQTIAQIAHPLIREALRMVAPADWVPQIEVTTLADVPAGTGLGSSSACACALIMALREFFELETLSVPGLAEAACHLEMDILGEPIGKQDAYASAYGGMTPFLIATDGRVTAQPGIDWRVQDRLEDRLQLYFTGFSRSASEILQNVTMGRFEDNLQRIASIGHDIWGDLRKGILAGVPHCFNQQWLLKGQRAPYPLHVARIMQDVMQEGAAEGGKLVGAGGGGFLLFYTRKPQYLRTMLAGVLPEMPFEFVTSGTSMVCQ